MADSDDFGDDLDDTAFLEVATQAEKETTPSFQPSPRPLKRRKIHQPNEISRSIPPSNSKHQFQKRPRRPFVSSDEDDDQSENDEEFLPPPRRAKRVSTEREDDNLSTTATSVSSTGRKRRAKKLSYEEDDEEDDETEVQSRAKETMAERRRNRIHVPTAHLDLTDAFLTQPPLEASPPWKTRGAIWQKPATAISVHRPVAPSAAKPKTLSVLQSVPCRPVSQASELPERFSLPRSRNSPKAGATAKVASTYDPTEELADLPSDAFASSPTSPNIQNDNVMLVSERRTKAVAPQVELRQTTLFGRGGPNGEIPASQMNKRYSFVVDQKEEPPTHHKLDLGSIKTWVYPTNLGTIRDYQFNVVARGLFHNTLVALPTGLGKTFIAATIMLNWFRWTKEAQIVFMAPTKPLVSQQIDACFHIVGIPRSETTMLIGGVPPAVRAEEWASKRVFFMTPQTLLNDLKSGYADPKKIILLVVDEAHRATGSYAYVEVVSFLRRFNNSFRVLALTATPGADVEAVQKVIDGLDISRVEIRTENSLDIRRYVHQRKVEKHVFTNSDEMEMCMDLYSQALQSCVNKIAGLNAFWTTDPREITPYGCMQARKRWFQEAGQRANQGVKAMVNAIFSILGSISQGMELLKFHGIGPFYVKMKDFRDSQQERKSKYRKEIVESDGFKKLMVRLQTWTSNDNFIGHPKLEFLQQVIIEHFVNAGEGQDANGISSSQTRIMVFAHFRDSAEEIVRVLRKQRPMVRPCVFVGQSAAKNSEGMNQKEQLEVIEKFKAGTFNTLVATSIGEEGLDIGEVDLIICFDSKASPIRMLQRMGRTGRKREGKIVMLQMRGKEENDANKAKDNYERMQELIAEGSRFTFHDEISRRIIPRDVQPVVERRVVEIPIENSQSDWLPEPKKKRGRAPKKPPKKFHMPDGVITGFVTAGRMDEEVEPKPKGKKAKPVFPSEELLELAPIDSVLLDDDASKDLERRFQTVFDDDDTPMIGALNFSAHSDQQRALSRTHFFDRHGRATQLLVRTLQKMHDMDDDRLVNFKIHAKDFDWKTMPSNIITSDTVSKPVISEEMWASDDPASQTLPKPKTKPGPKPKAKTVSKSTTPRGRPRKDARPTTPIHQAEADCETPKSTTPRWHRSGLADEGASSSPPPTDPRMRIASQAETIGSDDTIGTFEAQDTQAYRLDSDLVSFVVEDDEDIGEEVPDSSLPVLDLSGIGKSTQAIVKAARPQRPKRAEKIFTSDPTDDDAIVSSDSDDDVPMHKASNVRKGMTFVVESASEDIDDDEPVVPRKRARRVIEDDDDE